MTAGHTNRDFCWFSTLSSSPATCKNRTSIWIILSSLASQTPKGACRLCMWTFLQCLTMATNTIICQKHVGESHQNNMEFVSQNKKRNNIPSLKIRTREASFQSDDACSISSQPYSLFSGPLRLAIWLSFVPTGSRGTHCRRFLDPADLFPSHSS